MSSLDLTTSFKPLMWWSDAALQRLAHQLESTCRAWAGRWDAPLASVNCVNAQDAADVGRDANGRVEWQPWQADAGALRPWAWAGVAAADPATQLAALLFGEGVQGPMGTEACRRAWAELGDDIARLLARAPTSVVSDFCAPTSSPWQGHVRARITWARAAQPELWFHFAADAVSPLLRSGPRPSVSPATTPLVPLASAMAQQRVTLNVELAPTELDLGTLQSLRPGDVLTLSHRLDAPFAVQLADRLAPPVCMGHLGARQGRRAIEIVRPTRG